MTVWRCPCATLFATMRQSSPPTPASCSVNSDGRRLLANVSPALEQRNAACRSKVQSCARCPLSAETHFCGYFTKTCKLVCSVYRRPKTKTHRNILAAKTIVTAETDKKVESNIRNFSYIFVRRCRRRVKVQSTRNRRRRGPIGFIINYVLPYIHANTGPTRLHVAVE